MRQREELAASNSGGLLCTYSILLVGSVADISAELQRILRHSDELNGALDCIPDLASARKQLRRAVGYDLVLLTLDLPDSHGLDTFRAVHGLISDLPIVIVADAAHEAQAWAAMELGAQGVLRRELSDPQVVAAVLENARRQHLGRLSLEQHIRELELTNDRFLSLVADNTDAIMVVDRVGIIRFVNASAERLLRSPASDLLGQMLGIPLEGIETTEVELPGHSGWSRTAELHVMRTLWDGERAFIVSMRDISEQKRVELDLKIARQTAEQANKMKSQFLANMSHELRTPLNAIIGYSDLMRLGIAGQVRPAAYRKYIDDINAGGMHLLSLIDNLLDLSKAEEGSDELAEEQFDLVNMARSAIDLVIGQAQSIGLALTLSTPLQAVWIRADRRMIKQVLLNLLSNAMKFTPKGGSVKVEIDRDRHDVTRMRVVDSGIGIPGEQLPRAFAAFVRVHDAYVSNDSRGTGLGLALTKRFVELHHGRISVDSAVDVGTTVTVELPRERAIASTGENRGAVLPLSGRRPGGRKSVRPQD